MTTTPPVLTVNGIEVIYNHVILVLKGVSLQLAEGQIADQTLEDALLPVEAALSEVPEVKVNRDVAGRLLRGQSTILRGRDAPIEGTVWASCGGDPIALCEVEAGELVPRRVFVFGP